MPKKALLILSILFLAFSGAGLAETMEKRSDNGSFIITAQTEPSTPVVGTNTLTVTIRDGRSKAAVEGAAVDVVPWMTLHGHGSPKKARVKEKGKGEYEVSDVYFTMEGDWDLLITIQKGGVQDTASVAIKNVKR